MSTERNHFRELTFNLFHRNLPPKWLMTDIDCVWYTYKADHIIALNAIVDIKASRESFVNKHGALTSALCATLALADSCKVPFYIIRHNDAYTEWDVYHVRGAFKRDEVLRRASTQQLVKWAAVVRGRNWEEDFAAMNERDRDNLKRLLDNTEALANDRQTGIASAIENAFERLLPTWKRRVFAKLSSRMNNRNTPSLRKNVPPPNNRWQP